MDLLDRLEAARSRRDATRASARDSILASIREADAPDEVEVAWTRFAERMDDLVIDPADIGPLRQTVLECAVRGRLVRQDPSDEPASALLIRIVAERQQGTKAGKAPKSARPLTSDDTPFRLPETWTWCRLEDAFVDLRYGTAHKCRSDANYGYPVLRSPNIDLARGTVSLEDMKYAPLSEAERNKWRLSTGQLLLIRSNGSTSLVGRAVVVPKEADGYAFAGYLIRVRLAERIHAKYVRLALESRFTRQQIEEPIRTTSGVKNVNSTEVGRLALPLPPLAEQHRIVARVDEVMGLLDRLEARLIAARTTHAAFAAAAVHHLDA
jgi:type I restriction enzyme S subunit